MEKTTQLQLKGLWNFRMICLSTLWLNTD